MVKKRKSVLKSSSEIVDSPIKSPRIIRGNRLEQARNSLNEALDRIVKKNKKKSETETKNPRQAVTENDVINLEENEANQKVKGTEVKDSLVLKLRDRSIDLASFNDNTGIYPICRAWIKNDPLSARHVKGGKSDNLGCSFKNENESSIVEDYVYKLPPPKSKSEVGLDINCKMPKDLPKDVKTSMDVTINNEETPTVSDLLNEHKKRWGIVRKGWVKYYNQNESRYSMSKSIFNSMLNKDIND